MVLCLTMEFGVSVVVLADISELEDPFAQEPCFPLIF